MRKKQPKFTSLNLDKSSGKEEETATQTQDKSSGKEEEPSTPTQASIHPAIPEVKSEVPAVKTEKTNTQSVQQPPKKKTKAELQKEAEEKKAAD